MTDHLAAYQGVRARTIELVSGIDEATAESIVPATPDWRVKDVLAHVVGVNADVLSGNIEGAGTDPWTAVQVEARRDRSVAELVTEWEELTDAFDAVVPHIPDGPAGQLVFDAVTHEHDLRGALHTPGGRDTDAMAISFDWAADVVTLVRADRGAGPLLLRTEAGERLTGEGEAVASVRADRFELLRAMTGRRSADQIDAYDWDGDPSARTPLAFFKPRPTPLVE